MKTLLQYINEDNKDSKLRREVKFTIWNSDGKKVKWLNDNKSYQKIEYQYTTNDVEIQFMIGYDENSWKLWIGKIGAIIYNDEPYYSFETQNFSTCIINAIDKVIEIIKDIESNKKNWIQFYVHI